MCRQQGFGPGVARASLNASSLNPACVRLTWQALAAAALLEGILDRESECGVTIVVDVGRVAGGKNARPYTLMPVIRGLSGLLSVNYPERLRRLVIFPVPRSLMFIWSAVRLLLDPVTAAKAVLLAGGEDSGRGCRYDPEQLGRFIDLATLPDGPLYGLEVGRGDGRDGRNAT